MDDTFIEYDRFNRPISLHVARGFQAAVIGAVLTLGLTFVIISIIAVAQWVIYGSPIRWTFEYIYPLIGCTAVGAATGWSVYAPIGKYRVALSLVYLFLGCYPLYWLMMELLRPKNHKFTDASLTDELLIITAPPLIMAVLLTYGRINRFYR